MKSELLDPADVSSPPDKTAYRAFPELAKAIRSQSDRILHEWRGRTLAWMPELAELTVEEFKNSIARILAAMADALESNDPPDLQRLMQAAPAHGFQRFLHDYNLSDLFGEERVLRRVIVVRVEDALGRRCSQEEAAALHGMIDIMLQQGVLALVQEQKKGLRHAAEAQLKYLSFLSHDLNNNFFVMSANLRSIERELSKLPHMDELGRRVGATLAIITRTRHGMRRLLEHEQLRNSDAAPAASAVRLREIVEPIVELAVADERENGPRIEVSIEKDIMLKVDPALLTIILQNLIGNAIKHGADTSTSGDGTQAGVRVEAERCSTKEGEFWDVSVVDDGPGIPSDQLDMLFNAFERLPEQGESLFGDGSGFGLGLAIASQAARLLGTKIQVETRLGHGSRFSVRLPAIPA